MDEGLGPVLEVQLEYNSDSSVNLVLVIMPLGWRVLPKQYSDVGGLFSPANSLNARSNWSGKPYVVRSTNRLGSDPFDDDWRKANFCDLRILIELVDTMSETGLACFARRIDLGCLEGGSGVLRPSDGVGSRKVDK